LSRPRSSSVPNSVRHAFSQIPCSCQCCNRRQHVEGEGNSSGRNRHAAPVCRTQRIPSRQARFGAGGRPRLSRRRFGLGSRGSINFHCSSVNSFCRFFNKRPELPSGLTSALRSTMYSWAMIKKRELNEQVVGGGRCRRSDG
jgi:hypothetical protein